MKQLCNVFRDRTGYEAVSAQQTLLLLQTLIRKVSTWANVLIETQSDVLLTAPAISEFSPMLDAYAALVTTLAAGSRGFTALLFRAAGEVGLSKALQSPFFELDRIVNALFGAHQANLVVDVPVSTATDFIRALVRSEITPSHTALIVKVLQSTCIRSNAVVKAVESSVLGPLLTCRDTLKLRYYINLLDSIFNQCRFTFKSAYDFALRVLERQPTEHSLRDFTNNVLSTTQRVSFKLVGDVLCPKRALERI